MVFLTFYTTIKSPELVYVPGYHNPKPITNNSLSSPSSSISNTMFQSLLTKGKERKQEKSKNILCSRVSFNEGKERKIKHVVFPSFI
ncbi:hypothetical protein Hanom_Chr08g00755721 [Helianthus anomalus]